MYTDVNEFLKSLGKKDKQIYTYARVMFSAGGATTYSYIADGEVEAGDLAAVVTSEGVKLTFVKAVTYGTEKEAPYEFSKLKHLDEVIPYGSARHKKLLTYFMRGRTTLSKEDLPDPNAERYDEE